MDKQIAGKLKALRLDLNWSLDILAKAAGISRATLSRLENGDVSPTASNLGKLCAAYGITMSRLMAMVETEFEPLIAKGHQTIWNDPESGYLRRSVSPPADQLKAELIECIIPAKQCIDYPKPPIPGLEHHLYLLDGSLRLTLEDRVYDLTQGDCLRYQLFGASVFETESKTAHYILAII